MFYVCNSSVSDFLIEIFMSFDLLEKKKIDKNCNGPRLGNIYGLT